jgi:hypothetical protein|tara:strand:- start:342 stop:902 length:561 start_codon:yes stop_codon:yes gene_type:complete
VRLDLPEYNVTLIDYQQIHKSFEQRLINELYNLQLLDSLYDLPSDCKKLILHFTIKETVDYLNSFKTNNKLLLYFNNTQFYDSEVLKYIDEPVYLKLITKMMLKIRTILPIKVVISSKSLEFFSHLLTIDDGRARGTLIRIIDTVNKFKVENFTFEKVKKFSKVNNLTFLSGEYFNNMKTKQIAFK